jgi:hypothetical protein
MDIELQNNLVYKPIKTKKELREYILNLIFDCQLDKVIYKGIPQEINYKILKKILVSKDEIKTTKRYINPDIVRNEYYDIIQKSDSPYCIIIKK